MWVSFTGQRVFSEVWGLWPLVGSRAVLLACYLRAGSGTFIRNICGLLTSVTGRVGEKRREDSVRFPDRVLKMQSFPLRDSQGGEARSFKAIWCWFGDRTSWIFQGVCHCRSYKPLAGLLGGSAFIWDRQLQELYGELLSVLAACPELSSP